MTKDTLQDRNQFADDHPRCFCSDDDNCGCTFPQNIESYCDAGTTTQENIKIKTGEAFIEKDTVCYCTPKDCSCTIDYQETDTNGRA